MFESLTILIILIGIVFIFLSYYINDKKQNNSSKLIDEYEEYQSKIKEINNKIFELNEFSEFVKTEIDEKHKELLFLYQLINEKSKDYEAREELAESNQRAVHKGSKVEIDEELKVDVDELDKEAIIKDRNQCNKKILELADKGYDVKEIAKVLNIGQGEVRFVLNLFQ